MVRNVINVLRSFLASRHYRVHQIVHHGENGPVLITAKHSTYCEAVMYLWQGSERYPYHQLRKATDEDVSGFVQLTSEWEAHCAETAA
jgi:hypothetical protein